MKKIPYALVFLLLIFIFINGCKKADEVVSSGPTSSAPTAPVNPFPSSGATNLSGFITVRWDPSTVTSGDTARYDVYLGTSANPTNLITSDRLNNAADIGILGPNTTYYWRVIAKNTHGQSTSSAVWNFKTAP
jgi:PBP1b-binding outer membrane lipoprotein LpoB